MLNPLLASDSHQSGMLANVQRHNGLEAWRRIVEPINEDKSHVGRDMLSIVTNSKGATSMDGIEAAVETRHGTQTFACLWPPTARSRQSQQSG